MKPNLYICHTAYQVLVDLLRAGRCAGRPHTMVLSASVPDTAALAARLAERGTRHFLLAHLSETNNYPAIAYDETASALAGSGATVAVAEPRDITMLVGAVGEPVARAGARMPAAAGGAERSAASAMGGALL